MKRFLLCIALFSSACLFSQDEYSHEQNDFSDALNFSFDDEYNASYNSSNNDLVHQRVGRFSDEDSFDSSCVDDVIASAPAAVKKIIINLLYPPKNKAALPKRLLLVGKPGTGKTTLAKAIAYKCGYDYYVIEAPFLLNEYKNSGPQNLLREIYPLLHAGSPVVVILDELTELTDRYKKENDSDATVAAALWILLDSCAQFDNVFFIGTSNKEKRDLPLQLQSRFDEDIVTIYMPHAAARKRILQHHLKQERHKIDDTFLRYLIKKTDGRSAREIEKLVFKAIQFANVRTPRRYTVTPIDFERALKLWKPFWHPTVVYQTIEPYVQPFFKTAFPIMLQAMGLVHAIYCAERQHKSTERGLALQEASYALQVVGQTMQEKAHRESMDHQNKSFGHQKQAHEESFGHQQKAHKESMDHQNKSFDHQKQAHQESFGYQQKAHKESMDHQNKSFDHQKQAHQESFGHQQKAHKESHGLQYFSACWNVLASLPNMFNVFWHV
jgi:AAA+ superfamily predicted ATPase